MSKFNFKKARENARRDLTNDKIGAIVFGQGGEGKSTVCGTFEGRILYLYSRGESHAVLSASMGGGDVEGVRIDLDDEGKSLGADASYERMLSILSDEEGIKKEGFNAVVVDSLMEIENIVRLTSKFKAACLSDKGAHNKFNEPIAVLDLLRPILVKLKDLQLNLGIHYAVTCPLNVSERGDMGEVLQASPKLSTYSVAEGLVLQFPDIVLIGRLTNEKGVSSYRFQFQRAVSKESKDKTGSVTKFINFAPRLAGVSGIPSTVPGDMKKLAELKRTILAKQPPQVELVSADSN